MGRRYRRKKADIQDIIPPLVGLIFLCVFFVPGFKQLLGSLFVLALCFLGLVVLGLIVRAIWRKRHPDVNEIFPPPPRKPAGGLPPLVIPKREISSKPDTI